MGTIDPPPLDLPELYLALRKRFGKTRFQRLEEFDLLKQSPTETTREFYDRVQSASINLGKDEAELIGKFLRSLRNKSTMVALANHVTHFQYLADALEAVERYERTLALANPSAPANRPSRANPNIICR